MGNGPTVTSNGAYRNGRYVPDRIVLDEFVPADG